MRSRKPGTHMGVNLKTEEDLRMHESLQDDGAMMDWIAVPNFLDAVSELLSSSWSSAAERRRHALILATTASDISKLA